MCFKGLPIAIFPPIFCKNNSRPYKRRIRKSENAILNNMMQAKAFSAPVRAATVRYMSTAWGARYAEECTSGLQLPKNHSIERSQQLHSSSSAGVQSDLFFSQPKPKMPVKQEEAKARSTRRRSTFASNFALEINSVQASMLPHKLPASGSSSREIQAALAWL